MVDAGKTLARDDGPDPAGSFVELLAAARAGSAPAQAALTREYRLALLTVIRRELRARWLAAKHDTEDFAQMVWMTFFRHLDRTAGIETPAQFCGYLASIASNTVRDEIRHLTRQSNNAALDRSLESLGGPLAGGWNTPSSYAIAREGFSQMMKGQSQRDQEIITRRTEGQTYSEIAQALKISTKTVQRVVGELLSAHFQSQLTPRLPATGPDGRGDEGDAS